MAFETPSERIFNLLNIQEIVRDLKYVERGMDFVRFKFSDNGNVFEIKVKEVKPRKI
jgi:hypothetical protein